MLWIKYRFKQFHCASWLSLTTIVLICLWGKTANGATPDAGSVLREELAREQVGQPKPKLKADLAKDPSSNKPLKTTGTKIDVQKFRITGLTGIAEEKVAEFLSEYTNQTISLDGLHDVAERFEAWLRKNGLFTARAYVPPQDITNGEVEIHVLEGRLEGVDVKRAEGMRLSDEALRNIVTSSLPVGGSMDQSRLERGILLANDMPSTSARVVLVPGKELGGSRVLVETAQGPVVSGAIDADNGGSRYTGELKGGASIYINDPLGRGDQWSARVNTSESTSLMRVAYTTPLGFEGWKAGANYIDSKYKLCCSSEITLLQAEGASTALSAFVSYPLIRSRLDNLTMSVNWADRTFTNRQLGATTSDKKSNGLGVSLNGDNTDALGFAGLGGYTTYAFQLTMGNLNLDAVASDKAQDATSAQTQGNYEKWTMQLTHLMRITKQTALYAGLATQWAGKNLDSSEKFVLGGAQGVRAYPTGEASGDNGMLLNLEYRYEINDKWGAIGFIDYGSVQQRKNIYDGWNNTTPNLSNSYDLSGYGISIAWTPVAGRQVSVTAASKLGDNPARDANGNNSDGRSDATRFWLQTSFAF